ncbi:MAG: DUF4230 domain-containing protein [Spirochaetales bacterium]|nr:DUF4230 domain-containing protein [Spirochaetales bacterium]
MSGRSKGKIKHKFLLITLLILIVTTVILITVFPEFGIKIPFIYNTKSSSTEIILREIHKVSTLSTVEYIYKSVFPFDFLDKETDWKQILSKRTENEFMTTTEKNNLWLYDQCISIGIDPEHDIYDFVVITSIVEAGFNFEDKINEEDIIIEGKNISLRIPQTIITKFTIEDPVSSKYQYPDMDIDPMNWKQITNYVEEKIRIKVLEDGILKSAEARGNEFIKSLLIESGWESVVFIQ